MNNMGLLIPAAGDRDRMGWATVTALSPLRIRLDGESTALPFTPDTVAGGLAVNDRVWVAFAVNDDLAFRARRVIVLGKVGGDVPTHTHAQADITGLVALLAARPLGELGRAERTSNSGGTSGTDELPILRLDDIAIGAARAISVYTNTVEAQSSVNGDSFFLRLRYTTDGSTPTIGSAEFEADKVQTVTSQGGGSGHVAKVYHPSGAETLSLLLSLQRHTGTGSFNTVGFCAIIVEDIGAAVSDTGTDL